MHAYQGVKLLGWTGWEAMIGHNFSADGMPFEMALVQYSFQGLS